MKNILEKEDNTQIPVKIVEPLELTAIMCDSIIFTKVKDKSFKLI